MSEKEYTITAAMLEELDALYEDADVITPTMRHRRLWGVLVDDNS